MEFAALVIFFLVYAGMILGNWPGLAIDRTGIALLGAIAFIFLQNIALSEVASYVDLSTIAVLFSFMVISAQFYYSGFYTHLVERLEKRKLSPPKLLLTIILISGTLSAVLLNDIVCLALTPLVIRICFHRNLNPLPFLLGVACASNIGSSLTLIGNPQNVLIGQTLKIPFADYMRYSAVPCILGLFATWGIIVWQTKNRWASREKREPSVSIPYDRWQSMKGMILISLLFVAFFFFNVPRDHFSLIAAGLLLLSRKMTTRTILNFIDWQLLVLFIGLFVVNKAFLNTHYLESIFTALQSASIDLHSPAWLFVVSSLLSNLVSNVPAVMLLLPFVKGSDNGSLLAISSTLAGNMFIVGSIANLIVISQASLFGVKISWKKHLLVGLPLTLLTLLIAAAWFYLNSTLFT
jgi:Na+/H+ antiporter NhaD/arsenite permease-like protein